MTNNPAAGPQNNIEHFNIIFSLNWPTWPIQSLSCDVRLFDCLCHFLRIFFNVLLLPFTKVESQIGQSQNDSLGISYDRTLVSDLAILARNWSKITACKKVFFHSLPLIVDGSTVNIGGVSSGRVWGCGCWRSWCVTFFVDTFCRHFLWTLFWTIFVNTFCGHIFLHYWWTLFINIYFVDTFCEHFFVDNLVDTFVWNFLWLYFQSIGPLGRCFL